MGLFWGDKYKIDFNDLFIKADNLRNNGLVDAALDAYNYIAKQSTINNKPEKEALATLMAGVTAIMVVRRPDGSYYQIAKSSLNKAFFRYKENHDETGVGVVCREAGVLANQVNDLIAGEEAFTQSLHILEGTEAYAQHGLTYIKYANLELKRDATLARELLDKGYALLKKEPTAGLAMADGLSDMAYFYFAINEIQESFQSASAGLSWFDAQRGRIEFNYQKTKLYNLLHILNILLNKKEEADKNWKQFGIRISKMDVILAKDFKDENDKLQEASKSKDISIARI